MYTVKRLSGSSKSVMLETYSSFLPLPCLSNYGNSSSPWREKNNDTLVYVVVVVVVAAFKSRVG